MSVHKDPYFPTVDGKLFWSFNISEHVEMVKAIKGTNLELFDMNECDDIDATVDGGDVLYTGFGS